MADEETDFERKGLNDVEIALMDAIKAVVEILLTQNIAQPDTFDQMFTHQRDTYIQKKMPDAAAVMEMLRQFASNPQRAAQREAIRTALREPPKGTA